ncbi:hypothetical protein OPV22_013732 [Ensete ventricosum]|uniref:Uncharacterized protein n=1 Tax=Ensete ventricosum TaxID=4639 RepID=A0AAV8R5J4_ENSVE|nr:hypothetical protein OPV22_013732 [Ensete ventricosum]
MNHSSLVMRLASAMDSSLCWELSVSVPLCCSCGAYIGTSNGNGSVASLLLQCCLFTALPLLPRLIG